MNNMINCHYLNGSLRIVLVVHQIKECLITSDILDMMHYFLFIFITNLEIH